jgi:hypothetical protein
VLGHRGIEYRLTVVLQRRESAAFVSSHHPRVANHIGRKDGRKASIRLVFGHAPIRIEGSSTASASAVGLLPLA